MREGDLTIGKLAELTGCVPETIRFYEKKALLPAPPRTAGGHRLYDEQHIAQLIFIVRGRQLGFSLHDIETLLALDTAETAPCTKVRQIAETHLTDIKGKIADLRRMEHRLAHLVKACKKNAPAYCPIIDALSP